jgi:AcrR family transcriptional regulator
MKKAKAAPKKRAYHHGDLADQLVAAAEAIILERGVDGFTLREAARRAGVSPAAPAHHFKDARGLLSEVALRGFRDFGDALEAGDKRGGPDPQKRLHEQGLAYVAFALENPARFQLMFAHGKCDMGYKNLGEVAHRSFLVLEGAVRAAYKLGPADVLTPDAHGFLLASWSIVHGFAHLALGGDMDGSSGRTGDVMGEFLPLMLKHLPMP